MRPCWQPSRIGTILTRPCSPRHLRHADELLLLHVVDAPKPANPMMVPKSRRGTVCAIGSRSLRGDGGADRVRSLTSTPTVGSHKLLEGLDPANISCRRLSRATPTLIVMGSQGTRAGEGATTRQCLSSRLEHGPCAKLILQGSLRALKEVLLPIQGPRCRKAAVRISHGNSPFTEPVNVKPTHRPPVDPPLPWPVDTTAVEQLETQALRHARDFVEDVAGKLRALGYTTRTVAGWVRPHRLDDPP